MADLTGKAQGPAQNGREVTLMGWMESIDLPELGLAQVKSKIDTGARTSALHVTGIEHFQRDGAEWVRFNALTEDDEGEDLPIPCEAPVVHWRWIKNTSGVPEERVVIRTRARFGMRLWTIDLSLADRTNMTFPMIIGRAALKNHGIAVHTRRAFLVTERPHKQGRKDSK